ncbi:MAG: hypothetical protein RLZZ453_621 [Chlamydiota bacterium]|jgi:hypothetical protein
MDWQKPIPILHALYMIVGSMFVICGIVAMCFKDWGKRVVHYDPVLTSIIQTGSEREALPTEYLLELLDLSYDRPMPVKNLEKKKLEKRLLASPLIRSAKVDLIKPGTLYVDYEIRRPIALLEDYVNIAIDKEGYPIPLSPFFSPKNLPAFYLGLGPFGIPPKDKNKPLAAWHEPLRGQLIELCFSILSCVSALDVCDQFAIQRIDVSSALAGSSGRREVVVITQDVFMRHIEGHDVEYRQKRFLRLHPKHFAKDLGNYLSLRKQLLEQEQNQLATLTYTSPCVHLKDKVLDFRLDQLAFISE